MAYDPIPDSWREAGEPVANQLIERIHDNLEDHEDRLNGLSIAAGSIILHNAQLEKPLETLPIGSIIWGSLSDAQLQSEMQGGSWQLCDGTNVSGSDWATLVSKSVVPDARGRFLRMKAHGTGTSRNPDGDVALDTFQDQAYLSHQHVLSLNTQSDSHTHGHSITASQASHSHTTTGSGDGEHDLVFNTSSTPGVFTSIFMGTDGLNTTFSDVGGHSHVTDSKTPAITVSGSILSDSHDHVISGNTNSSGGSETRPMNVTENAWIKINKSYITTNTRQYVIRINQQLTINQVQVTPIDQGTSGNFQIDIKKGSTPATATTSIFTALPTLAFNGGSPVTGTINAAVAEVNAGEFIVVTVPAVQAKMKAVHIFIAGDI